MPLQGELRDFPLEEIIDLLNEGGKTGVLDIEYEDEELNKHKISIYFKNGKVVYATDNVNKKGIAVIETAAKLFDGKFVFIPGEVNVQDKEFKKLNFKQFKLRFHAILDKWKPLKEAFPTLNDVILLEEKIPDKLNLTRQEWDIISEIGEGKTIKELIDKSNIGEITLLETLLSLKEKGVIKIEKGETIDPRIASFIPRKIRAMTFVRPKDIEDETAQKVFDLIDGKRTIKEIASQLNISIRDVKKAIEYLAKIERIVKPKY